VPTPPGTWPPRTGAATPAPSTRAKGTRTGNSTTPPASTSPPSDPSATRSAVASLAEPPASSANPATTNTITYIVNQPPIVADIQLSYTWQYGPFHPESVVTYNDFRYADHTSEALWPGTTFAPYEPTADVTPALYLGFDKQPPAGQIGVFLNMLEQRGETLGAVPDRVASRAVGQLSTFSNSI
jgi:hypothetical protein